MCLLWSGAHVFPLVHGTRGALFVGRVRVARYSLAAVRVALFVGRYSLAAGPLSLLSCRQGPLTYDSYAKTHMSYARTLVTDQIQLIHVMMNGLIHSDRWRSPTDGGRVFAPLCGLALLCKLMNSPPPHPPTLILQFSPPFIGKARWCKTPSAALHL